jgi:hypothetical protein
MTEALQIVTVLLLVAALAFLLVLFRKVGRFEEAAIVVSSRLDALERAQVRIERTIREEVATTRGELTNEAREQRQELGDIVMTFGESIAQRSTDVAGMQNRHLDGYFEQLASLAQASGEYLDGLSELATSQKAELEKMSSAIVRLVESNEKKLEAIRVTVENKLRSMQSENIKQLYAANSGRKTTRHARKTDVIKHEPEPVPHQNVSEGIAESTLKSQSVGELTSKPAETRPAVGLPNADPSRNSKTLSSVALRFLDKKGNIPTSGKALWPPAFPGFDDSILRRMQSQNRQPAVRPSRNAGPES